MPRGHPDFGATAPRELTTPQLDSGELAARLGSPNVYDRLGTVIALYTADQPIAQIFAVNVGSGRRDNFLVNTPFGAYAWRLTATADGHQPGVAFIIPLIGSSPVGAEVVFRKTVAGSINATLDILADDGTNATLAGVRWEDDLNTWQHINSSGTFVATPNQPQPPSESVWGTLKTTVDPATQLYGRSLFDGVSHDLIGVAADPEATALRSLRVRFFAEGNAAATVNIDVAAVIVTVNEL